MGRQQPQAVLSHAESARAELVAAPPDGVGYVFWRLLRDHPPRKELEALPSDTCVRTSFRSSFCYAGLESELCVRLVLAHGRGKRGFPRSDLRRHRVDQFLNFFVRMSLPSPYVSVNMKSTLIAGHLPHYFNPAASTGERAGRGVALRSPLDSHQSPATSTR